MIYINIFLVVFLILATAFFVAAEFSFIKVRPSRIEQLVLEGNNRAKSVQKIINNLDGYLSACQLGITITALGLGWLGEPTVKKLLYPVFELFNLPQQVIVTLSFLIAFSVITFLHVVLGELVPKTIAIRKAESISFLLATPMMLFHKILYPFIWLLNGTALFLVRIFGIKPASEAEEAHSEDELKLILEDSFKSGEINQSEFGYVNRIFEFDELKAREIMVPRIDIVCLFLNKSQKENFKIIREEQYTRFPIADGSKDNIIGMINTKQFFFEYLDNPEISLSKLIRPVLNVSETIPIKELLRQMQKEHIHMAILYDEYGGTSGMVTIEDILEEIVGDIRDEFDTEESADIEYLSNDVLLVDGKVLITDINELLNFELELEQFETIGGWLYAENPLLQEGDEFIYHNIYFKVRKRGRHRYRKIEIQKTTE